MQGETGSDGHVSSSTLDGLTPNSSVSSQVHSSLGNPFSSSHRGSSVQRQRYWLHVRQQPRAGRACSNSKDRRALDPPPIVQLLVSDFDPKSSDDMEDMTDQSFVVHCVLCSASPPPKDISVMMCHDDSNDAMKAEKQIIGSLAASPFFCDDPDPTTAPQHPSSQLYQPLQTTAAAAAAAAPRSTLPSTFFCFPDLSVRRAGVYRLEFQLLKVNMDQLSFPILHSVLTEPFNVVNAKDFDHVQPSTPLVRGLVARGAGFPLKLKQGSRAQKTRVEEQED